MGTESRAHLGCWCQAPPATGLVGEGGGWTGPSGEHPERACVGIWREQGTFGGVGDGVCVCAFRLFWL